jgi:hypothetical protein
MYKTWLPETLTTKKIIMNAFWKFVLALTCIASVTCCILLAWPEKPGLTASLQRKSIVKDRYRVSFQYAKDCIETYKRMFAENSGVTSFLIERQDFLQVLGIDSTTDGQLVTPFSYARGYLGYDSAQSTYHMFFTPVVDVQTTDKGVITYAGRDTILKGRHIGVGLKDKSDDEDPYVLDLNAPCPTTCNFDGGFNPPAPPPPVKK